MLQWSDAKIGDTLVCSVCGKEFKVSDDTKYICKGGYTCTWKCFLNHVRSLPPKPVDEKAKKKEKIKMVFKDFKKEKEVESEQKIEASSNELEKETLW